MDEIFVHTTATIDAGAVIGKGSKVWHYTHVMEGARIGERCTLGQNVFVASDARIGDDCKIQNNVSIFEGVELEDEVFCGPSMVFTNVRAPRATYPTPSASYAKILVRRGATIGANATIVCGATIGQWALVAAGAVVTSDVPAYALFAGLPARRIGWVCECGRSLHLERARWICQCGRRYLEAEGGLESET